MDLVVRGRRWSKGIGTVAVCLVGLMGAQTSWAACEAGGEVSFVNPLKVTVKAKKMTCKETGAAATASVEAQIVDSLKLIKDGKFEQWRTAHCHPERCDTASPAWDQMKNFNLKTSQRTAGSCLKADNQIWVVKKQVIEPDKKIKVFISCDESSFPSPSFHEKVNGKWTVQSFSW